MGLWFLDDRLPNKLFDQSGLKQFHFVLSISVLILIWVGIGYLIDWVVFDLPSDNETIQTLSSNNKDRIASKVLEDQQSIHAKQPEVQSFVNYSESENNSSLDGNQSESNTLSDDNNSGETSDDDKSNGNESDRS